MTAIKVFFANSLFSVFFARPCSKQFFQVEQGPLTLSVATIRATIICLMMARGFVLGIATKKNRPLRWQEAVLKL